MTYAVSWGTVIVNASMQEPFVTLVWHAWVGGYEFNHGLLGNIIGIAWTNVDQELHGARSGLEKLLSTTYQLNCNMHDVCGEALMV